MVFNNYLVKILFFLIPISLIAGTFVAELFVNCLSIIFLYFAFKEKKLNIFFNNIYAKIFFVWCLYLIILSFFSDNIYLSLSSSLFYFRFGIFALAIWFFIQKDLVYLKFFYYSLVLCLLGLSIDGFYQFIYGENLIGFKYSGNRLSSFFGSELILGSYISRLMPIFFSISTLLFFNNRFNILFSIVLLILADLLIYFSGERAAFFYLICYTLLLIILLQKHNYIRLYALLISILLVVIFSIFNPNLHRNMFDKTASQINLFGDKLNAFSPEHQNHYESALKIFYDNYIFGVGPKMFRQVCGYKEYFVVDGCNTHPHNIYIQLLAETGIVGAIFILSIFIIVTFFILKHLIYKFRKINYFSDYQVCLIGCFFIYLWPIIPSGNFFHNWLNIIYFIPIGLFLAEKYKNL